ncbi:MAG TPA: DUF255 domain-containing protein [Candidatus Didemnitutus sp.]|nr:DUF255 domain-containing protein [Candidatus Didemnitutus sp.]
MNQFRVLFLFLALATMTWADSDPALAASPSEFVRSQAGGAVHWQSWDATIVDRAKAAGKPVYLFAGSQLNELTRATARQTFANAEVAAFLNENFFCVLVDRDEQPDLAAAIQYFLKSVKQQDGWPAHLWLTPELQPYEGAAYLPPSEEWGKPSFMKVARQAKEAWADAKACRARAADAVSLMKTNPDLPPPSEMAGVKPDAQAEDAIGAWRAAVDATNGGFGTAPKALDPELIRVLLTRAPADRDLAVAALRAAINGATHDPLDGGFFPRTTDAAWKISYFQKGLSDQARIALACLDAAKVTGDAHFGAAARGALDYAMTSLALRNGGYAAAVDATGDENGSYYTWTDAEIDAALGANSDAFKKAYGVAAAGNISPDDDPSGKFKGRNILRRVTPAGSEPEERALAASAGKLYTVRSKRPAPARSLRATAAGEGLMLAAFSRGAAELPDAAMKARLADAAGQLFAWLQKDMVTADGDVRHLPTPSILGGPADYFGLAFGCREYAKLGHPEATKLADQLVARANERFLDAAHGRYLAAPAELPPGVFVRAPATGDAPSAECLAVQAGVASDTKASLARTAAAEMEAGSTAPGDVLFVLTK